LLGKKKEKKNADMFSTGRIQRVWGGSTRPLSERSIRADRIKGRRSKRRHFYMKRWRKDCRKGAVQKRRLSFLHLQVDGLAGSKDGAPISKARREGV